MNFLNSRKNYAINLVQTLKEEFQYVSILGTDVRNKIIQANGENVNVIDGESSECGFVVKIYNGDFIFEYSMDDIEDIQLCKENIKKAYYASKNIKRELINPIALLDEALIKDFERKSDIDKYSESDLIQFAIEQSQKIKAQDEKISSASCSLEILDVSKIFISSNRQLSQHYVWNNGVLRIVYKNNGKAVRASELYESTDIKDIFDNLPNKIPALIDKAQHLSFSKPIVPGVYDVITDSTITGLIAHEAFGHGVELDMFVKDRALAKHYMNKYVASPLCNMRDGAASALSVASYFFDDDGVLACDTQMIKDGILVSGISDLTAACELGLMPTGNARRESFKKKSYSRMTNTFFDPGKDNLEDMIASIKHGYIVFETSNGMEDPKNWAIQCVAQYGIEIIDGKLTENYAAPVVISGNVLDVLNSVSMISKDFFTEGLGYCGKGHKESVKVSDGGPALKARLRLG